MRDGVYCRTGIFIVVVVGASYASLRSSLRERRVFIACVYVYERKDRASGPHEFWRAGQGANDACLRAELGKGIKEGKRKGTEGEERGKRVNE